jgi:hypothetical protein
LGFSPQISNFPSQQGSPPSRIYCQKSNLCIFTLLDQFSNHFLSASASCYFPNLLWLYIFIYILWGPKNGLQQYLPYMWYDLCDSFFYFPFISIKVEYNLGVLIQVVNELVLRLDLTSILIVSECIWFACDLDRWKTWMLTLATRGSEFFKKVFEKI